MSVPQEQFGWPVRVTSREHHRPATEKTTVPHLCDFFLSQEWETSTFNQSDEREPRDLGLGRRAVLPELRSDLTQLTRVQPTGRKSRRSTSGLQGRGRQTPGSRSPYSAAGE
jgi:hypothetical protein